MTGEAFYESEEYQELLDLTNKLERWYIVPRSGVTWYVVYVYDINDPYVNLFDIWSDEIVTFDEEHIIPEKAAFIVQEIQEKLREINRYLEEE